MQNSDSTFSKACLEISNNLLTISNHDNKINIQNEIKKICKKYTLAKIPKKTDILSVVPNRNFNRLRAILVKKPTKTSSGVAIIAVMPKPYACPHGKCTYCPGGIKSNSPNSYTGNEPITLNSIKNNFDPKKQITDNLQRLLKSGHNISKIELVVVGGTFLFMPKTYQEYFIKSCYDVLNGCISSTLEKSKKNNENARVRIVGFTLETKPDYCKKSHIQSMLKYGITRIEIGVQNLQQNTYEIVNRGHNLIDVINSFHIAKDFGFKIVAHMMPGLPGTNITNDIKDFITLFTDLRFKPDMLKIYPTLVIKNTKLYEQYVKGNYKPYTDSNMIKIIMEIKKNVPKWMRIMRIQREIQRNEIIAGPKMGNLRQIINNKLQQQNILCKCIRCREIGLNVSKDPNSIKLSRENYYSSDGYEVFLSCVDKNDKIYAFLRLRLPSKKYKIRSEKYCIVRELHVYGKLIDIGDKEIGGVQHYGLGKMLIHNAEKIAREEFDSKLLLVISAVGTREYYRSMGYYLSEPYMEKKLHGSK